ncbi:hypothetical protein HU200_060620 [Digitaria exilis]|uniref:Uncharacterized protein n=1 Tax=Digitaria exilis TaxID=1010633 RepID=A0A835A662_9POAL|nr:hypothetical protein HU200_060620 [Digitaria exilis]
MPLLELRPLDRRTPPFSWAYSDPLTTPTDHTAGSPVEWRRAVMVFSSRYPAPCHVTLPEHHDQWRAQGARFAGGHRRASMTLLVAHHQSPERCLIPRTLPLHREIFSKTLTPAPNSTPASKSPPRWHGEKEIAAGSSGGRRLWDAPGPSGGAKRAAKGQARRDVCVEVDRSTWGLADVDHRDVAEVVLRDVTVSGEGEEKALEETLGASRFSLRLRVRDAPEEGFRMGQWPIVASDCVLLEHVVDGDPEEKHEELVVWQGAH